MKNNNAEDAPRGARRFYSVAEVARMFGMSSMTLYREIADERFPAVRIRTRLFVPAKALDEMAEAAIASRSEVSAADWVVNSGRGNDVEARQSVDQAGTDPAGEAA